MVLEHTSLRTYTLYTDDDEGPLRGSPVSGMWWQWGVGGDGGGGGEGWCFSICAARGRPGPGGLSPAQANGRINEKGRQAI